MGELCRLEVRSSNQKSLLVLGLITNILAQRIDGCNEGGGASGIRTRGRLKSYHQGRAIAYCLATAPEI